MRVTGPSGTNATQKSKKKGSASSAGGNFGALLSAASSDDAAATGAAEGSARIEGIDALLALQEIGGETGGSARAAKHGNDILDQLEKLRDGLLSGRFSKDHLLRLADLIKQKKETFVDPHLQEILDDIDLRAAVELAKFDMP